MICKRCECQITKRVRRVVYYENTYCRHCFKAEFNFKEVTNGC